MKLKLPHFLTEPEDEQDEGTLNDQGIKQELNRSWGLLHNFGVSFSIIVSGSSALCTFLHAVACGW